MKGKSSKNIFVPNLLLVVAGTLAVLFSLYSILNIGMLRTKSVSVLNTLENEYYVVGKDPTALQKEKFELLSAELKKTPKDQLKIADLVSQSFVIDFFNLSNKDAAYDVGGLQYMQDPKTFNKVANFEYYQKVEVFNNLYGKGTLPEVTNVSSTTKSASDYKIGDTFYPAYNSKLTWNYNNNSKLDIKDFVSSCELVLIDVDGKITIAEVKMIDEDVKNEN